MNVPSGYTALDLVGFTDKGTYSSSSNYVRNDLVHYQGKIWKCKVDDTTNVTPTEGAKWTVWVNSADKITDLTDVNISSVSNNQVLGYNSTTSKWENKTLANVARTGAASDVTYNNTQSGLSATNVKGAIDEVSSDIATLSNLRAELGAHNLMSGEVYALGTASPTVDVETTFIASTGVTAFIAHIEKNTDYVISRTGGNRFIVALSTDFPAVGGSCMVKETNYLLNSFAFNSGNYNYVFFYVANSVVSYETAKPLLKLASDPSDEFAPFSKPNTELTKDTKGLTENQFENGAVNLWENNRASNVINGVTYVVNADKTITASRSEQGSTSIFYLVPNNTDFSDKRYKISGCPSGGSGSTYCIKVYKAGDTIAEDIGNGAVFTGTDITIAIVVFGQTTGTFLFKPMITVADMPNSDYAHYVPYAKSNKELTDAVVTLQNRYSVSVTISESVTTALALEQALFDATYGLLTNVGDTCDGMYIWAGRGRYKFSTTKTNTNDGQIWFTTNSNMFIGTKTGSNYTCYQISGNALN